MLFGLFVLGAFNLCLRGAIVNIFWRWFILSKFNSLPELTLISSIGLSMFIGALTLSQRSLTDQEIEEPYSDTVYRGLVSGAYETLSLMVGLVTGWVVHLFM